LLVRQYISSSLHGFSFFCSLVEVLCFACFSLFFLLLQNNLPIVPPLTSPEACRAQVPYARGMSTPCPSKAAPPPRRCLLGGGLHCSWCPPSIPCPYRTIL
jgi:hypothetical protein